MTTLREAAGRRLVLASTSKWRQQLLVQAGLPCLAIDPGVDEDGVHGKDPVATAAARAAAKADAVAARFAQDLVIGADQVLWWGGEATLRLSQGTGDQRAETIGKPQDPRRWLGRLQELRGQRHELTTAVALRAPSALGGSGSFRVRSGVKLRADLTDDELAAYIEWGEAAGCAGGYMVEGRGAWLVEYVDGDWFNVVGLPVLALIAELRKRGWSLRGNGQAAPPGAMRSWPG